MQPTSTQERSAPGLGPEAEAARRRIASCPTPAALARCLADVMDGVRRGTLSVAEGNALLGEVSRALWRMSHVGRDC